MVVERKISADKYILAGLFTILLFALGVALGMLLDNERLRWLEQTSKDQELDFKSLQFQYLYLTALGDEENSCPILQATLKRTVNDLSDSLNRFQEFKEDTQINSDEYRLVGRRYLLDNLNYWILARKSKTACGLNVVNVLYFYDENCDICPNQGVILTYFKNVFGDKLLVFPIDGGLSSDESVIDILRSRFNVSVYPSLVIEDQKFEGVVERNRLKQLICGQLKNESAC